MGSNYFFWGIATFVLALAAIPGVSVMFVLNLLLPNTNPYALAGAGLFTMIFLIWIWSAPRIKHHGPKFMPFFGCVQSRAHIHVYTDAHHDCYAYADVHVMYFLAHTHTSHFALRFELNAPIKLKILPPPKMRA